MTALPSEQLVALLRANAEGLYASEAAVELLIAHGSWLRRADFLDACVRVDRDQDIAHLSVAGDGLFAGIDWHQVPSFVERAPCSGSEGRMLRIAAELAGVDTGIPLAELLSSLDDTNSRLVVAAIAHTRQIDIGVSFEDPGS